MPAFDSTTRLKIASVHEASRIIQIIASVYIQAKRAQELLQLYTSGTDAPFVAAVNAMMTPAERQEIGAMLSDVNTLVTAWEAQHPGVIASG